MLRSLWIHSVRVAVCSLLVLVAGCQTAPPKSVAPTVQPPLAMHSFVIDGERNDVVGQLQVTYAHEEDTLLDIARRFNLGYEEIVRANPQVDPWLPHEGARVILPTQFVLPDAPRSGIVINLAALRLFYFPPHKPGEPQTVITHPIGIGQIGWSTPLGKTKVIAKKADPWWFPPASVRKEHLVDGDPLPAKVGPGPENPLGRYALTLDWPSYLIHGTNQPYGVGLRASHGCIRLFPEDIAQLFNNIPVGTPVTVVNQPEVYGWRGDTLYLQSYPVLDDYSMQKNIATNKNSATKKTSAMTKIDAMKTRGAAKKTEPAVVANAAAEKYRAANIDNDLVATLRKDPRGFAVPVSVPQMNVERLLGQAKLVENRLPANATWNGIE